MVLAQPDWDSQFLDVPVFNFGTNDYSRANIHYDGIYQSAGVGQLTTTSASQWYLAHQLLVNSLVQVLPLSDGTTVTLDATESGMSSADGYITGVKFDLTPEAVHAFKEGDPDLFCLGWCAFGIKVPSLGDEPFFEAPQMVSFASQYVTPQLKPADAFIWWLRRPVEGNILIQGYDKESNSPRVGHRYHQQGSFAYFQKDPDGTRLSDSTDPPGWFDNQNYPPRFADP